MHMRPESFNSICILKGGLRLHCSDGERYWVPPHSKRAQSVVRPHTRGASLPVFPPVNTCHARIAEACTQGGVTSRTCRYQVL